MAAPEAGLRATRRGVASAAGADVGSLARLLEAEGAEMKPLFGLSEERLRRAAVSSAAESAAPVPDLSIYYRVEAPDERLDGLAERLRKEPAVLAAYVKPPAEPAALLNAMPPAAEEAPAATADFTSHQLYLEAAPGGVDARFAWTKAGGSGAGVRIIDVEGAWRFSHEDLLQNQGGVIGGSPAPDRAWRNHGTAVIGEFGGDRNSFGITGICPDANIRAISIFGPGSAGAVRQAADALGPGDIILIELHRAGPRFNFQPRPDQLGYIAMEWWPDDFDAIRYATSRGILVVEPAGNGAENLDDPIYDVPDAGFPPTWSNPFKRGSRDSGAIVVGAGAPPPGTHGFNFGPDRSRLDFSNYGSVIDAQGWGREVTTCGYGDLQGGSNEDLWYTDHFSGTSSASPIVVGSLGCVQGALRAAGKPLLTPATARDLLRTTGSPQQASPSFPVSERIGNRPDVKEIINRLVPPLITAVALYRYWNSGTGDHYYTPDFAELRRGRNGYRYEGVLCYLLPRKGAGSVPLHRYWNPTVSDHFYTTNFNELGNGRFGYNYEGIAGYVYRTTGANRVPLYRYWNAAVADHFYTPNFNELGNGRYGYVYESIQCYLFSQAVDVLAPEGPEESTAAPSGPEAIPDSFRMDAADQPDGDLSASFQVDEGGDSTETPATFRTTKEGGGARQINISIKL